MELTICNVQVRTLRHQSGLPPAGSSLQHLLLHPLFGNNTGTLSASLSNVVVLYETDSDEMQTASDALRDAVQDSMLLQKVEEWVVQLYTVS